VCKCVLCECPRVTTQLQLTNISTSNTNIYIVNHNGIKGLGKTIPRRGLERPWGFQELEAPRFRDDRRKKAARLSALRTGRHYLHDIFLVLISFSDWVNPTAMVRPEELRQRKNTNDTTGNRTSDLPACSAVPQPTAGCLAWNLYENGKDRLWFNCRFFLQNI
jgi:hypothetical protein